MKYIRIYWEVGRDNLDEYIKKIEQLNLETIKLKNSKEYLIGKKIKKISEYLKKFKINQLIKKTIENKKIEKLNAHGELNNNFKVKKKCIEGKLPKIAVYTCITGNYDKEILEPFVKTNNIDFYLFTDNCSVKSTYWNIKKIPEKVDKKYNNILKNRYLKMHPYELFNDYDYSIYIDGNVQVMSDLTELVYSINKKTGIAMHNHQFRDCICKEIKVCKIKKKGNYDEMKKQVDEYIKEGFPKKFGMLEATIIITDLKNKVAKRLLDDWWNEFISTNSLRDQISLQYIVWKNNFEIKDIAVLGDNLYRNPKFRINIH